MRLQVTGFLKQLQEVYKPTQFWFSLLKIEHITHQLIANVFLYNKQITHLQIQMDIYNV